MSMVRKTVWSGLLLGVVFLLFPVSQVQAEEIDRFATVITLNQDGSFAVTESITYNFGAEDRHGIFRYIPKRHPQGATAWYKKRFTDIEVLQVTRANAPVPFVVTETNDRVELKIGDANTTVTGAQLYVIDYVVRGGLSYLKDGTTEIYWNATAHDSYLPIGEAAVLINDPNSLTNDEYYCYRGALNSDTPCAIASTTPQGVLFMDSDLRPGQGVTVAQVIDATAVPMVVLESVRTGLLMGGGILVLLLALIWWVRQEKKLHRPVNRTIVAQYEPYADAMPMYTGVLFDGRLDDRDITAGLLRLAQDGFISITKTDKKVFWIIEVDDYEITLLKPSAEAPTEFHKTVLNLLFNKAEPGAVTSLHDLKNDQSKQRRNYKNLNLLKKAIKKDLNLQGYYERFGMFALWRRRTRKGYEAEQYLKGFKEFLSVTDKDRFKFHNAPEKNPQQFMQYLPFAIAFGVEKDWANVFADMAIPPQTWYHDSTGGTFNVVALTSSLSAFSTAVKGASGSGYRSSSSASSGGGFSGGGGGGGGVGSW